jgi:hypothetical protein
MPYRLPANQRSRMPTKNHRTMMRGGIQMNSQKHILSAATLTLTLVAAVAFAAAAPARAGEGKLSGTYAGWGTIKATQIGEDRLLTINDHNAVGVNSDPMFGHLAAHCWGLGDYTKGVGQVHGYCVFTDPAGDNFVSSWASETWSLSQETFKLPFTLSSGTGKFAGITGTGTYTDSGNMFKPLPGTYYVYGTTEGTYKLP